MTDDPPPLAHDEARDPAARAAEQFARLRAALAGALALPAWRARLGDLDPAAMTDRAALARLPLLRKSELPALQAAAPPFGGLAGPAGGHARLYASPGPIHEGEGPGPDPWGTARALRAAGFRCGDVVLNTFGYHLTPGGFILDHGARALGCAVIPAGPGQVEAQLGAIRAYAPVAYCGTPDFLKILLDALEAAGHPSPFRRAVVSGAAFPPSLQREVAARGVDAHQLYASADAGCIAYETGARAGLVVSEDLILEVVRPGTGDPVPDGEVGEVVVTRLDPHRPLLRLALGDLTAIMPGPSPCGRTGPRIRGWMGRADQSAKVKGMFVRPEQVAAIGARHPDLGRLRLVVTREGERDAMRLLAEAAAPAEGLRAAVEASLRAVTSLSGAAELVAPGALPNDGRVIADERPIG